MDIADVMTTQDGIPLDTTKYVFHHAHLTETWDYELDHYRLRLVIYAE